MKAATLKLQARAMLALSPAPVTIIHAGATVYGCRASATTARDYRPEGYTPDYAVTVIAIASDFTSTPAPDDNITANGTAYKINGITENDPAGILVRLDLRSVAAGRG